MEVEAREIQVLPQQARFIRSTARFLLYSGSFAAGKSRAICLKLLQRVCFSPNAREGLCRKTFNSLRRSTLKTLLESDGCLPSVLPENSFTYNKAEGEIKIKGGGSILLFGCDDPLKLGSLNLTGCAVDEMVELTADDFTMLQGRIRMQVEGLPNQLYGACNPSSPSHWLCERFGLGGGHTASPNCESIKTAVHDNWFLDKDYVADLETLQGVAYKRFVLGEWAGSDGIIFETWDRSFINGDMPESFDRTWIAVDEGWNNPCCLLLMSVLDERLYIRAEYYKRKKLESEVVKKALQWRNIYDPEVFVVDPSSAKLKAAMRHAGLDVVDADNDVFSGISAVGRLLNRDETGHPLLTVHPSCENTIMEFESYEWKVDKQGVLLDKPVKKMDHAMDCLRYGTVFHYGLGTNPQIRSTGKSEELQKTSTGFDMRAWDYDHPMWSTAR